MARRQGGGRGAREPHQLPLAQQLDLFAFRDRGGQTGAAVTKLGDAYRHTGAGAFNGSALFCRSSKAPRCRP